MAVDTNSKHETAVATINDKQEESIAQSIVPYNRDDDRARYLGLRASGFKIREALQLLDKAKSTLSFWRLDSEFVNLESRLPEFKHELAVEYANLEFLRNYRLVMEKDFRVVKESLETITINDANGVAKTVPKPMSAQDYQYLLKLRTHYTPQQLQIIETIMNPAKAGVAGPSDFNFTELVLTLQRSKETLEIKTRDRGNPEISHIQETASVKAET